MKVDGHYYGQALREAESGQRRDDLWGKAFVLSQGDERKSKALYLDLLAQWLQVQDEAANAKPLPSAPSPRAEALPGRAGPRPYIGEKREGTIMIWAILAIVCFTVGVTYLIATLGR
jgi:hypothetical protein